MHFKPMSKLNILLFERFRCDLSGEYTSNAFCELLASHRTIHHTFCTDTLEQNSVIERKHMHIVELLILFYCSHVFPLMGENNSYCNSLN